METKPTKRLHDDPFLNGFSAFEIQVASEFLSLWLPFLTKGFCPRCTKIFSDGIRSLRIEAEDGIKQRPSEKKDLSPSTPDREKSDGADSTLDSWKDHIELHSLCSENGKDLTCKSDSIETPRQHASWEDMSLDDDELIDKELRDLNSLRGRIGTLSVIEKPKLSREQREKIRFKNVKRKKDFECFERVKGCSINVLEGIELHTGVFSAAEQRRIVDYVYQLQKMGERGELKERTYSAPQRWMRGKGRVTIQFGCCYNYAMDKKGNPPGILKYESVDPIPPLLKMMIKRMVRWHVLPPTCVPDSCIINIYEEGDCIPPHIDNHDFVRPFCTVSFLSECDIIFGSDLRVIGPGEFSGSTAISLPVGSVLVLNGNGADVAKHCVPAVPSKRLSITFRRMDDRKRPKNYIPEPDLQGIQPLPYEIDKPEQLNSHVAKLQIRRQETRLSNASARRYSNKMRYSDERNPHSGPRSTYQRWGTSENHGAQTRRS